MDQNLKNSYFKNYSFYFLSIVNWSYSIITVILIVFISKEFVFLTFPFIGILANIIYYFFIVKAYSCEILDENLYIHLIYLTYRKTVKIPISPGLALQISNNYLEFSDGKNKNMIYSCHFKIFHLVLFEIARTYEDKFSKLLPISYEFYSVNGNSSDFNVSTLEHNKIWKYILVWLIVIISVIYIFMFLPTSIDLIFRIITTIWMLLLLLYAITSSLIDVRKFDVVNSMQINDQIFMVHVRKMFLHKQTIVTTKVS